MRASRSPPGMPAALLFAACTAAQARPSARALGDGTWHQLHPGVPDKLEVQQQALRNAAPPPQRAPVVFVHGCAGFHMERTEVLAGSFTAVVQVPHWSFLGVVDLVFKTNWARSLVQVDADFIVGARLVPGSPRNILRFQLLKRPWDGTDFRFSGIGPLDTNSIHFDCGGLGLDSPPSGACSSGGGASYEVVNSQGTGFEAHVSLMEWHTGLMIRITWSNQLAVLKPYGAELASQLREFWGTEAIFRLTDAPYDGNKFGFTTSAESIGLPLIACYLGPEPPKTRMIPPPPPRIVLSPPPPSPWRCPPPPPRSPLPPMLSQPSPPRIEAQNMLEALSFKQLDLVALPLELGQEAQLSQQLLQPQLNQQQLQPQLNQQQLPPQLSQQPLQPQLNEQQLQPQLSSQLPNPQHSQTELSPGNKQAAQPLPVQQTPSPDVNSLSQPESGKSTISLVEAVALFVAAIVGIAGLLGVGFVVHSVRAQAAQRELQAGFGAASSRARRRNDESPSDGARAEGQHCSSAADKEALCVVVEAHEQNAELEIRKDAFNSFDELRELVVSTLPEMFSESDSIMLDFQNERGSWTRVKTRTQLSTVKAAAVVLLSCDADAGRPDRREQTKKAHGSRRGKFVRLNNVDEDDGEIEQI